MKRLHVLALASALVIFAMGLVAGVLAHRLYVANSVDASDDWRVRYVNEMHARLKLTPPQVDKLNDILDDTRVKVHELHLRYKPEMLKIKQDQMVNIQSMLSPQQAQQYKQMVAEKEARAKEEDARNRAIDDQRAAERHNREQKSQKPTK
jgi:hypothetical protein